MATAAHSQFAAAFKQLETRVDEHIVLHFSYVDELCNCEHGVLDLSRSLLLGKWFCGAKKTLETQKRRWELALHQSVFFALHCFRYKFRIDLCVCVYMHKNRWLHKTVALIYCAAVGWPCFVFVLVSACFRFSTSKAGAPQLTLTELKICPFPRVSLYLHPVWVIDIFYYITFFHFSLHPLVAEFFFCLFLLSRFGIWRYPCDMWCRLKFT